MIRDWRFVGEMPRHRAMSTDAFRMPDAAPTQPDYTAGATGRRLRTWRPPTSGPNVAMLRDHRLILARSRAAARNDPWAGSAQDRSMTNGIGTGITAKAVNGSEEERAQIDGLWNRWIEVCDADGLLHFNGWQGLAWTEWDEAGEVFARLRPRRRSDVSFDGSPLPIPLQVQMLESEQVPADLHRHAPNGNEIRQGIEYDLIGRRVAYWMYRSHPGDARLTGASHELVRVPADQVLHLYRPLRAGQARGVPGHVSVLLKMFQIDGLDDNVLERQKIANLFMAIFKQQIDPENPRGLVDDMVAGQDPALAADDDEEGLANIGLEPGTGLELPPGYDAIFSNPPAPGLEYWMFIRGHLLAIAARYGVPYEVLTGDLKDVSDRALKLILNEFRRLLEVKQWQYFIPMLLQRIRVAALDAAFYSGALSIRDYVARRAELVETLWVPQGWPYSHPVQDATADRTAIRAGIRSRDAVILGTGEDPEEVDRQIAAGNARADRLGLVLDSDPRKTSSAGLTQARPPGSTIPGEGGNGDGGEGDDNE